MQQCSQSAVPDAQPQQLHQPWSTLKFLERKKRKTKNPPDDRSHSSMRPCIQRSFHESLYLSAPAAPADVTSVWGAGPALLRLTGSGFVCHWHAARGWVHVFLHGAASAHPQSPRIGRTLLSSLGELTVGAELRRHERRARFIHRLGIQWQIVGVGWCWVASLCNRGATPFTMKGVLKAL